MTLDAVKKNLPKEIITYLLICTAAIIVLIVSSILPAMTYSKQLQAQIKEVKKSLSEQNEIISLYQTFTNLPKYDVKGLPMPDKKGVKRDNVELVISDLGNIATKSALNILTITPELSAISKSSKTMGVNVVLRGDFMRLRDMLFSLNSLSYLESIDEIQVVYIPLSKSAEFILRFKVAIKDT